MTRDGYSRAFEAVVFPVLDRLNATTIARKLIELRETEHRDPIDIGTAQARKLESILTWTREVSSFYQDFWSGSPPGPTSAFAALDGVPVVTKADLAKSGDAFPIAAYRGRCTAVRTSGSTGSPMTFFQSTDQISWFWALRFRIWGWAGYRPGDPYLEISFNPRTAWKKRLQDQLFRCTYLTYNPDNQDSRRIAQALAGGAIPHLNGFSSSLFALARYMLENGLSADRVVGVTATGDTLYRPYREAIESAFGSRVLDYYGAGGEGVHLASQCLLSGDRYHVHPENAIVEILGANGPVRPGESGRIVVTQLDNRAMPLIRYDLEDVATAAEPDASCPCGRTLPLLETIEGRVPDLVILPDGAILVTHFFVVLFKNLQSIHRYQIRQEDVDHLMVKLVARPECDRRGVGAEIRRAIDEATRGQLSVEIDWVEEIPLSGRGKRRLVVSEISRRLLARTPE